MILDFTEIPQANTGKGDQDTFEQFACLFLKYYGFKIEQGPDRGPDGGKDIIVSETLKGVGTCDIVRKWLVSCKHKAHSKKSVSTIDESNIKDRVVSNHCNGFIGFYSTLPSSGLSNIIHELGIPVMVFDNKIIEAKLLSGGKEFNKLVEIYFPVSLKKYRQEHPVKAHIFDIDEQLYCECCGKPLLGFDEWGNYLSFNNNEGKIAHIAFVCKGSCDNIIEDKYRKQGLNYDGWNDIHDLHNPLGWIKLLFAFVNGIQNEHDLTDEAYEQFKQLFICTFPYVARSASKKERERMLRLIQLEEAGVIF